MLAAPPLLAGPGALEWPWAQGLQHQSNRFSGWNSGGFHLEAVLGLGPELRSSRSGMESESAFLTKADAAGQGTSSENRGPRENTLDVHRLMLGN